MDDVADATVSLLTSNPEIKGDLLEILEVDEKEETWQFEDLSIDTGTFGEIVSHDIVQSCNGGYQVTDPEAVRDVLDGEREIERTESATESGKEIQLTTNWFRLVTLTATFGILFTVRLLSIPTVYRGGDIVLSGNDAYYYRFWVERLVMSQEAITSVPEPILNGEPLLLVVVAFFASALGGTARAIGTTLAWYPPLSALLTGVLLFIFVRYISRDSRVTLATLLLFAFTPVHAMRTSLGFADHHAFDYPWLILTALALVIVLERQKTDLKNLRAWISVLLLGAGIAAQVLAWEGGPLLILPVGLVVAVHSLRCIRDDISVVDSTIPTLIGIGLSALVVVAVHEYLGWHTNVVAYSPLAVFAGSILVVTLSERGRSVGLSARTVFGASVGSAILIGGVIFTVLPTLANGFRRGVAFLTSDPGSAESAILFSRATGTVAGPLLLFGLTLVISLPVLSVVTWQVYRGYRRNWLVPVVYTWFLIPLTFVQIRFGGELAAFAALFAGLGVTFIAAKIELARPLNSGQQVGLEAPDRRKFLSLAAFGGGVGSLSLIQTPIKINQVTIPEKTYRGAAWMRQYASDREWSYPDNYVFSQWGDNRVYNYFVNGQSWSFRYARQYYSSFLTGTDGERWYDQLADRVGFIVIDTDMVDRNADQLEGTLATGLADFTASNQTGASGLNHYRGVYTSEDESLKIYTPVEGAKVIGNGTAGGTITARTSVSIPNASFAYERSASINDYGIATLSVPYPGEYEIDGEQVMIDEIDVQTGSRVSALDESGVAYWPFDEGEGTVTYDRASGRRGNFEGATWTSGRDGTALSFAGTEDFVTIPDSAGLGIDEQDSLTISFFLRGKFTGNDSETVISVGQEQPMYGIRLTNENQALGMVVRDDDASFVDNGRMYELSYPDWTHVAAVLDRDTDEIRIYRNGREQGVVDASAVGSVTPKGPVTIGGSTRLSSAPVVLDEIRIFHRALSQEEIEDMVSGNS